MAHKPYLKSSTLKSALKKGHSHPIPAMFGADIIAGPTQNRTNSGYYPNYPMVRGYTSGYYRVTKPSDAKVESEAKSRGFKFSVDCKKFVILNRWRSLNWAYQLGLFYRPQFGPIDEHLNRSIDPDRRCIKFLQSDYKTQFQSLSKQDIQFYLQVILHYFKGLLQGNKFSYDILRIRFDDVLRLASKYGAVTRVIGRLYPISQAQLDAQRAQDIAVKTHPTSMMQNTPSAQMNPLTGTYDYSGMGAWALQNW